MTCPIAGNPIVYSTGNKIEPETDFVAPGEIPLGLHRTYNHYWNHYGLFGRHWLSNLDFSLATDGTSLWAQRPDGRRIKFLSVGGNRWNEDKAQPIAYIVKNGDGSYTLHSEGSTLEKYSANGYITELKNEQGIGWTFTYGGTNGSQLQRVTHTSGRYVLLTWTGSQLTAVKDPAGNTYSYAYYVNKFGTDKHLLKSTTRPDGSTITYHYEDSRFPGGLTGKSYDGVRYSTFAYDADGRATLSEHAGGVERHTFSYTVTGSTTTTPPPDPPPPGGTCFEGVCTEPQFVSDPIEAMTVEDGSGTSTTEEATLTGEATTTTSTTYAEMTVVETNPLGEQTTYQFVDGRLQSVEGDTTGVCIGRYKERTYDANGYDDLVFDFENGLTDYDYDAHGHLLKKTEKRVNSDGTFTTLRTTTYIWDETKNRLTQVTVLGDSETTYAYTTTLGRILSITVKNLSANGVADQTRTTGFSRTVHPNGLVATEVVNGPLPGTGDAVTYAYSTTGDLTSVTNSLGHTTTYSNYNALGLPGRVTGANGEITDYTYDARGRVKTIKRTVSGVVQTTTYGYNALGQVASIQTPDGQARTLKYDAAGRLMREYEPEAGGTYAQTRYTRNSASLVTTTTIERTTAVEVPGATPTLSVPSDAPDASYTVIWSGVSGAESYTLQEQVNGGSWATAYSGAALSKAYSGKAAGTYGYRVRACNAAGCTSYSGTKAVTVPPPPATAPTVSAPADDNNGSYSVSWNSVATATSYRLEEQVNGGSWTQIHNASTTSKAISGKSNGSYGYRARACNGSGCGPYSAVKAVKVTFPPSSAPSLSAPAGSSGSYTVTWTSVATAATYQLEKRRNSGTWNLIQDSVNTSMSITTTLNGDYGHRVRACNVGGCGPYSAEVTVTVEVTGGEGCPTCQPKVVEPAPEAASAEGGEL